MNITLHPDLEEKLLKLIQEKNAEQFVNDLLFTYLSGGFIRDSDVAGRFVTKNALRKRVFTGTGEYDNITKEFSGVSIEGQHETEAIFIVDQDFHDAIEENLIVLVMKSPRKSGIRTEVVRDTYITKYEQQ